MKPSTLTVKLFMTSVCTPKLTTPTYGDLSHLLSATMSGDTTLPEGQLKQIWASWP